ncbi:MAG: hypothetical protein WCA22_00335, partial [Candidatus Binatus sp.]
MWQNFISLENRRESLDPRHTKCFCRVRIGGLLLNPISICDWIVDSALIGPNLATAAIKNIIVILAVFAADYD